MVNTSSPIWAITTYFNPINYKTRYINYLKFRGSLDIPLITVELSFNNEFVLNKQDAEILIQIKSDSFLWQKERLLNIGINKIPDGVKYVAWLDCDVIFENRNWHLDTIEALHTKHLIQPFDFLYDLNRDEAIKVNDKEASGTSIGYLLSNDLVSSQDFEPTSTQSMRRGLFGLTWAAKVDTIRKFGFYDAMVIGSGDRALLCAAVGRFDDVIRTARLNGHRKEHYLEWARPFYNSIKGNVSYIEGNLFHLWHGKLSDRHYLERHIDFESKGFNPYKDIYINSDETWSWSENKVHFNEYLKSYFLKRKEDGE